MNRSDKHTLCLDSYRLNPAHAEDLGMSEEDLASTHPTPLCLSLCGKCFYMGALDPVISIGEFIVDDFEISSDECCIKCYLFRYPEDGAMISIDYKNGQSGVFEEPFTMVNLKENDIPSA